MVSRTGLLLWIVTFCIGNISGQEKLTLEEAITIALEENLGIQWVEKSYEAARIADAPGAAGMLPFVVFQSQAQFSINNTELSLISGETQSTTGASDFSWQSSVRGEWTLFDGFGKQIRKDQLELQEEQAHLDYKSEAYALTIEVARTYFQVVSLQKNLEILRQDRRYYKDLVKLARQRDSIGSGTRIDILQSETDLNTLNTEMAWLNRRIDAVYGVLNRLLNRDNDKQPAIDTAFLSFPEYDFEVLVEQTMNANYDLMQQEVRKRSAMEQLNLAKSNAYPVIDLFGSISYDYSRSDGSFLSENKSYGPTAGLSLEFPIYDGNRIDRQQQIARLEEERAVLRNQDLENEIEQLLFDALTRYRAYREQYQLESENVRLAGENFDLANEMYRFGRIDQFDLRQTRQQLLRTRQRKIEALYQLTLQRLQLIYLSGKPLLQAVDEG